MDGRKITNHSTRVTLCSTLYNSKYSDKAVCTRSQHRSNAAHSYQHENFDTLKDISNVLDTPMSPDNKCRSPLNVKPQSLKRDIETSNDAKCDIAPDFENEKDSENCLTINVPSCVKKIVIVKNGKRSAIDI